MIHESLQGYLCFLETGLIFKNGIIIQETRHRDVQAKYLTNTLTLLLFMIHLGNVPSVICVNCFDEKQIHTALKWYN